MYDYNNKSNEKQAKETVPTWSHNWLLLWNNSSSGRPVHGLPGCSGPGPFLPTGLKHPAIIYISHQPSLPELLLTASWVPLGTEDETLN